MICRMVCGLCVVGYCVVISYKVTHLIFIGLYLNNSFNFLWINLKKNIVRLFLGLLVELLVGTKFEHDYHKV